MPKHLQARPAQDEREERHEQREPVAPLVLVGDAVACADAAGDHGQTDRAEEGAEQQENCGLGVEQEDGDLQRLGLRRVDPPARLHG